MESHSIPVDLFTDQPSFIVASQIKLDGFRILSWLALPLLRLWADVGPVQLRRKQRLHPRGCLRGWSVDGEWRSAMA